MKKKYQSPEFEYIDLLSPTMMDQEWSPDTNLFSNGDDDTNWEDNWGNRG